jgi:hypothetical protein
MNRKQDEKMTTINSDGRIAKAVRRNLSRARKVRKRLDELDRAYFDLAVEAVTTTIILDARLKHGPFLPAQVAAYEEACRCRDATLAILEIQNPYRPRAN